MTIQSADPHKHIPAVCFLAEVATAIHKDTMVSRRSGDSSPLDWVVGAIFFWYIYKSRYILKQKTRSCSLSFKQAFEEAFGHTSQPGHVRVMDEPA